jgi:hypothetical protein
MMTTRDSAEQPVLRPTVPWLKTYTHCRVCDSPLNLVRSRVSEVSGYCLDCQYRPAFVLRTFSDGCREVSHPTRPAEWGSGPQHHHRLVVPWYEDCPNLRCHMGCIFQFQGPGRLHCDACWERYKAFKWRSYPFLAALFERYRAAYDALFHKSARRATKACPEERLLFYYGQSEDYRVCFEAIVEALLADTVEELAPRFAFNLQRFRAMIALAPPELCYFSDERLVALETMLAEVTEACEAEMAAQVAGLLAAPSDRAPGTARS